MITMLVSLFHEITSVTRSVRLEPYLRRASIGEDALSLFQSTNRMRVFHARRLCVANNRARVGGNRGLKVGRVILV